MNSLQQVRLDVRSLSRSMLKVQKTLFCRACAVRCRRRGPWSLWNALKQAVKKLGIYCGNYNTGASRRLQANGSTQLRNTGTPTSCGCPRLDR